MGRRASWAGAEYLAAAGIRFSNLSESLNRLSYPGPIVPSSATLWAHTLLSVIPETKLNKFSRPEEGGSAILRSIRTNCLSKATSELVVILTPVVHSVAPGSNLNTETGYPDFSVSVVVYWICREIPGFTLIRPLPHPNTFLYTRHISILMLYLFRAIY